MERILVLIKPDGMERAMAGKVFDAFESAGLKIVGLKMLKATDDVIRRHYTDDEAWLLSVGSKTKKSYLEKGIDVKESEREIGLRIREMLVKEITRTPIIAAVFEGNAAADVARKIGGATEPRKADPSTIRGRYASDTYSLADMEKRPVRNIVHISETGEIGAQEIKVWFSEKELFEYNRADWKAMY